MAKLREFQLADPAVFWRHLLSSAVLWGARRLQARTGRSRWHITLVGAELTFEELCNLIPSLSLSPPGRRGRALRQLALAITQLMAAGDLQVSVTAGAALLRLSPRRLSVSPNQGRGQPQRLELQASGANWSLFPRFLAGPKLHGFLRAARHTELALELNGRAQPAGLTWDCDISARLLGSSPLPKTPAAYHLDEGHEGQTSVLVGFYPRTVELAAWCTRGLLFDLPVGWPLPCRLVISHDGLNTDLLGEKLIEDQVYQEAHQHALEMALALAAAGMDQHDRLRVDLVSSWYEGFLPESWQNLPFLQLGGWPELVSPTALRALYRRQGYLALDKAQTPIATLQALQKYFPSLIRMSPYRELPALDRPEEWLLRVPLISGEVRYRDGWPSPPARVNGREHEGLPAGLELQLRSSAAPADPCDALVVPLLTCLAEDPQRFLGSAAALNLVLWLSARPRGARLTSAFPLRRAEGGSLPLQAVLGKTVYYLEPGQSVGVLDRSREPLLCLCQAEAALLQGHCQLEPLSDWKLDSTRLAGTRNLGELGQQVLEMCLGVLGAIRGYFLNEDGEVVSEYGQPGVPLERLMESKLPLRATLVRQIREGPTVRTALSHPPQTSAVDLQRLRLFASLVMAGHVLYFERAMRHGPFQEPDLELLSALGQELEPLIQRRATGDRCQKGADAQ